ncbi:MAG: serine protease, subtilase family [Candidatus Berkelbacteria bacterium]|nr:serine protease, subtilase family [Candidatus Berkelbacteria bacterium]
MKKKTLLRTILVVSFLIVVFLFSRFLLKTYSPQATEIMNEPIKFRDQPPAKDKIIVKFKKSVNLQKRNEIKLETSAKVRKNIPKIDVDVLEVPEGKTAQDFVGEFQNNYPNEIEYAEVDGYYQASSVPNDTYYASDQSYLKNLNSETAWDITTGTSSVKIAVLDTGVELTHSDLQGKLIPGWDFVYNDPTPEDAFGHGTAVTGVLGALTNNNQGIAGVTWQNPILEVRIAGESGYSSYDIIANAIIFATDNGAKVINISFGGYTDSLAVRDAVNYAWQKNTVVVASAGNDSTNMLEYPASMPNVVGVSALDETNAPAFYTNYGSYIDVAAPGTVITTSMGNEYRYWMGTSFASPCVAGLLGLIFSLNPTLTSTEAVDILERTATDLGTPGVDDYYGHGKINLARAAQEAAGLQPDPMNLNISLKLQSRNDHSTTGANLKIYPAGSITPILESGNLSTDSSGKTSGANATLWLGNYDLKIKAPNFLSQTIKNKALSDGILLDFGILKGGDIDNNNIINSIDFSKQISKWSQSDPLTDINKDGTTNSLDFGILNSNWFVQGQ